MEPLLLGLLAAFSLSGLTLALAVVATFLLRQPLKIWSVDRRRGQSTQRTILARRFLLGYALLAALNAAATVLLASSLAFLQPLALAMLPGAVFLFYDLTRPGRSLQAELAAPLALGSVAASIAILGGRPLETALVFWALLTARSLPSILYVRTRIRLDRGRTASVTAPLLAHIVAFLGVSGLSLLSLAPWWTLVPFCLLLGRALLGLSAWRPATSIKAIGFSELGLGVGTVIWIALCFA